MEWYYFPLCYSSPLHIVLFQKISPLEIVVLVFLSINLKVFAFTIHPPPPPPATKNLQETSLEWVWIWVDIYQTIIKTGYLGENNGIKISQGKGIEFLLIFE